jgi:hypothetical protein
MRDFRNLRQRVDDSRVDRACRRHNRDDLLTCGAVTANGFLKFCGVHTETIIGGDQPQIIPPYA